MLSSLRRYFRYLIDMDRRVPVPPETIQLVKTIRTHPKISELAELIRLIESPSRLDKDPRVTLTQQINAGASFCDRHAYLRNSLH